MYICRHAYCASLVLILLMISGLHLFQQQRLMLLYTAKDINRNLNLLSQTDLGLARGKHSWITEEPAISPDADTAQVLEYMDTCLTAVKMRDFFEEMGYMQEARQNARAFITTLRKVIPKTFSSAYDSPCWKMDLKLLLKGNVTIGKIGGISFHGNASEQSDKIQKILKKKQNKISSSVVCLPKAFLAGFPKCGSTFLYCVVQTISGSACAQFEKEPHWWAEPALPHRPAARHILKYLLNFVPGARLLANSRYALTIDATQNLIFEWPRFVAKEEPPVNYCLLPSLVPVVLPHSKYVVVMRDPVKMLYSAFWNSCTRVDYKWTESLKLRGPSIFHERTVTKITIFNDCLQRYPLERCALDITDDWFSSEMSCGRAKISTGLYYIHVHKWLSIVPRENFMFLTTEELITDTKTAARGLWHFLGTPSSAKTVAAVKNGFTCAEKKNAQRIVDYHHDPRLQMRNDTEKLLKEFYKPYNKMLADLLDDNKFLWEDE